MHSDEALYARVKQGDLAAFDELYARYETRLFGFLMSQLANRADAEEVFHEAFMNALKSREVRFDRGGFRTWLYRVARNAALNRQRSQRRGQHALAQLPPSDPTPPADKALAEHELLEALDRAVAQLPETLSEV